MHRFVVRCASALLLLTAAACAAETPTPPSTTTSPAATQVAGGAPVPSRPAATAAPTALPATSTPAPSATATAVPTATPLPPVVGYNAHIVGPGENLSEIADRGGSDPTLLSSYNRLSGPLQPGRELIVPLLQGRTAELTPTLPLVIKGNTKQPWVALTFDAADHNAHTTQVLNTLQRYGARVTFFLTGQWIRNNPELVRRMVAEGHEISSHGFTHVHYTQLSNDLIRADLEEADRALRDVAGISIRPFFRPPYGDYDRRVLEVSIEEGYLPIYWTYDVYDTVGEPKSAAYILERMTRALPPGQLPGAIILAHLGIAATADALPAALDRFIAMGFEIRPVSDVLGP